MPFSRESLQDANLAGRTYGTDFMWIIFLFSVYVPGFLKFLSEMLKLKQFWKFLYGQRFGKSSWSVKKWLDRYQKLQPHADAWKGPAYQISAWLAGNCLSYGNLKISL